MSYKEHNFSLWCDFIERDFLEKEFMEMIQKRVVDGATSNPAIFKEAFLKSPAYKEQIKSLKGKSPKEIYEALAIEDIKRAADIMTPLYQENSNHGFISIEIDPLLCDDYEASLNEAKRLYKEIDRENLMIKVPATKAGYKVIKELIAQGINVNATLIFSLDQAKKCMDAFEEGLEEFYKIDLDKKNPKGVISIFVSRFDRKANALLEEKGIEKNRLGIINATNIYNHIIDRPNPNIRALFASTGVKGDDLPQDYYIKELLYKDAINTAPLHTIEAFLKNDDTSITKVIKQEEIESFFLHLQKSGINLDTIIDELLDEGLEAFKSAFKEILKELEKG